MRIADRSLVGRFVLLCCLVALLSALFGVSPSLAARTQKSVLADPACAPVCTTAVTVTFDDLLLTGPDPGCGYVGFHAYDPTSNRVQGSPSYIATAVTPAAAAAAATTYTGNLDATGTATLYYCPPNDLPDFDPIEVTFTATVGAATGVAIRIWDPDTPHAMIELCGNPLIASHNGFNIIEGSAFEDQIWGTSGKDLILGYEGNDDIKGFEGDDVLCGGEGADGLNGGSGHDQLFGAEGRDLIFGNSGSDTIIGGDGVDGLFGGDGSDAITGGIYVVPVTSPWVPVDDDAADYVIGGPMPDMVDLATGMVPGTDDEIYQETQSNNSCPGWMYVPAAGAQPVPHAKDPAFSIMKLGVFNPNRLYIVDAAHPCLTIRGKVRDAHPAGDGDEHMNVQGEEVTVEILDVVAPGLDISVLEELAGGQKIVLELMPRDKLLFDTPTNGATVVASGLLVKDFCHGTGHVCDEEEDAAECEAEPGEPNEICHLELHPVYSFKVGTGATKFSGPREGGSPYAIKPDWISGPVPMDGPGVTATDGSGTHYRYCWLALGGPCAAWGGSGGAFQ